MNHPAIQVGWFYISRLMATDTDIKQKALQIKELLLQSRLKDSLDLLDTLTFDIQDWSVVSKSDEIKSSYRYMLQYFAQSSSDEGRQQLFNTLRRDTLLLTDDVVRTKLQSMDMTLYYQYIRSHAQQDLSVGTIRNRLEKATELSDTASHEQLLVQLFSGIWTSRNWEKPEFEESRSFMDSPILHENDKALLVSAVTISLLQRIDPLKFEFLYDVAVNGSVLLSVRAIMGILLTVNTWQPVLELFPEMELQINELAQRPEMVQRALQCQMAMLLSLETKEIDRKMREDIIPAMLKNPKLGEIITEDINRDDISPDWTEWISDPVMKNRFKELSELQVEGADVYMSTFANLKNYPMFKDISGWFRLFDVNHPDVQKSVNDESFIASALGKAIVKSAVFCNSDKYSFILTFSQIPKAQRDMIAGQVSEQMEAEAQEMSEFNLNTDMKERIFARQYAQDLYRFFNLFYRKHEFSNPFEGDLVLTRCSALAPLFHNDNAESEISQFLLRKKHYSDAIQTFELLEESGSPLSIDYRFYQQKGYAQQKTGNHDQALESYLRADILQADNPWTLKHLAQCYRMTGMPEKALPILCDLERLSPDDLSLLIQTGDCLVDMKRYDEALSRFFKADYLAPDQRKTWRAIAWCAFLAGQNSRALEYYGKLTADVIFGPTADLYTSASQDFLNMGHVHWIEGHNGDAIIAYKHAIRLCGTDIFMREFDKDSEILINKGKGQLDLILMKDSVV